MNKTLTLTESQANEILNYLGGKPFKEVYTLIGMIQSAWNEQNPQAPQEEVQK